MTTQGARTTLLFVAGTIVVVGSIYLSYKQRHPSGAGGRSAAPSNSGPAVPPSAEPETSGWVRPRVGEFRKKVHGWTGDLADVPKRVRGGGEQVAATFKLGGAGRRIAEVDLTPDVP
jgi:hypothetical protein